MYPNTKPFRPIRSFVRRQGRMTEAQKAALDTLWPIYGLDPKAPFDAQIVFKRKAPLIIEIGFGNGENLAENAEKNPHRDYLGIEVHDPGVGYLLHRLAKREIENVRIIRGDALEILRDNIPDDSAERIHLFFPDPWPKKRHHKRRLVSSNFAELLRLKLVPGGYFHAATDWEDYAGQMTRILNDCEGLDNVEESASAAEIVAERCLTRFERRGLSLGHRVRDLVYTKRRSPRREKPGRAIMHKSIGGHGV